MKELLIDHRQRLDGDVRKVISLEIQVQLPVPAWARRVTCESCGNPANVGVFRCILSAKFQGKHAAVEPLVQSGNNTLQPVDGRVSAEDRTARDSPTV